MSVKKTLDKAIKCMDVYEPSKAYYKIWKKATLVKSKNDAAKVLAEAEVAKRENKLPQDEFTIISNVLRREAKEQGW